MSNDPKALEEQFPLWLAACDEALAAGAEPDSLPPLDVPGELKTRLQREVAWCQFVRQTLPHAVCDAYPSTLAEPATASDSDFVPETVTPPKLPLSHLGRFVLLRELGRGSFGVVFLARDPHLGRDVALKVPRAEALLTPELRGRFQHEARAAAALDHPNVVPIYEAGEVDSICYIAQAYCPGTTLAVWLKHQTEPVPAPLAVRLMMKVAEAVHHAHERGVLHRDLKPGNVMLEALPGRLPDAAGDSLPFVPRVMDFGLAKLVLGVEDLIASYQTHSNAVVGTPQYMAPEQAEGNSKRVGPAADVYALGVLLYEILTGRPPFRGETVLATLQLVRSQEPLSPAHLRPGLPRDLETICLHCLQKEPGKRYAAARELADDLGRFLAREPIRARPVSALERLLKWMRRRPAETALIAVSTAALLVVGILIGVSNVHLREQRNLAEAKRQEADEQRLRALLHLRNAHAAVDQMLSAADRLAPAPYTMTVRRQLLKDALRLYQEMAREEDNDPELHYEVGRAYRRVGQIQSNMGQRHEAVQNYRKAIEVFEQLTTQQPDQPSYWRELAASCNNLSVALDPKELTQKIQLLSQALSMQDRLAAGHPNVPGYSLDACVTRGTLAAVLFTNKQYEEADRMVREAAAGLEKLLASAPSSSDYRFQLATVLNSQAAFLGRRGRITEAEPLFRRAVEVLEPLAKGNARDPENRSRLVLSYLNLGTLLAEQHLPKDGEKLLRRAAEITEKLASDFPEVPGYHAQWGKALSKLAGVMYQQGNLVEAGQLLEKAIHAQLAAFARDPNDIDTVRGYGINLFELAELRLQQEDYREAVKAAENLRAVRRSTGHGDYEAARVLGRCIGLVEKDTRISKEQSQSLTADYARRAVEYLRLAVQKGRKDAAAWDKDPAFARLRARADFQKLLKEAARKR